jgi:hypothetical protein
MPIDVAIGSAMCDQHVFRFDVDKAYEDQLVSALKASPGHPLSAPEASSQSGVYVLLHMGLAIHVGRARDLRSRLRDHRKTIENRKGIKVEDITCRFLTIERMWEVKRAKDAMIRHYSPRVGSNR